MSSEPIQPNRPRWWSCCAPIGAVVGIAVILAFAWVLYGFMYVSGGRSRSSDDMECSPIRKGSALVFNATGKGERDLYFADLATHSVRRLAATLDYETAPDLSPDGKWVTYAAGKPGERQDQLYIRSVDGAVVRQLTSGNANICSPRFSLHGDRILFARDTDYRGGGYSADWDGGGALWSVRTDGKDLRRILPQLAYVCDARISRDGKWVVYMGSGICVARLDGTGATTQVAGPDARYPDFSPDGKSVIYVEGQYSTTTDMYIVAASGGKPTKVLGAPQSCFYPHFTPDGKSILFQVESWPNGGSGDPEFSLWRVGLTGAPAVKIAGPVLFNNPEFAHP